MQYTPQQMQGYQGFNPKCRIGNWSEDVALQEAKMEQYFRAKNSGNLISEKISRKMNVHLQKCKLSSGDVIQFGDIVMLQNKDTLGYLSFDLDDDVSEHSHKKKYGATTGHSDVNAVNRNCYVIHRVKSQDLFVIPKEEENYLHYGQPFTLRTVDDLGDETLFLTSEAKSTTTFSPVSCQNEVYFSNKYTYASQFIVDHLTKRMRLEYEGDPVNPRCGVVIRHMQTNQFLSSETKFIKNNDFGKEYEVCGKTNLDMHKKEKSTNVWSFVNTSPKN